MFLSKRAAVYVALFVVVLSGCDTKEPTFPVTVDAGDRVSIRTDTSAYIAQYFAKQIKPLLTTYAELVPFKSKRSRPFIITIISDKDTFLNYQKRIGPTKSEYGFYIPERGELVLHYRGQEWTLRILKHEAFHAFMQDRIIHPPAWLDEGLAEYAEHYDTGLLQMVSLGNVNDEWHKTLARLDREGTLPHIKDLVEDDWPDRHNLTPEQYALSWSLIYFFRQSKDESIKEKFNRYLQLLYNKKNHRDAFYEVWPNVDELNEQWHVFVHDEIVRGNRITRFLKKTLLP